MTSDNKQEQSVNLSVRFWRFIKAQDNFGIPVSLTYKRSPQIKSTLGGAVTILTKLGILAYLLYLCAQVLQKQSTIKYSIYQRDLTTDDTEYSLTSQDMDLGFYLEYLNLAKESKEFQANFNIYRFAYPFMNQNIYTWINQNDQPVLQKTKIQLQTENCQGDRLGLSQGSLDHLGVGGVFTCASKMNLKLKGNQASRQYKYVNVQVSQCNQTFLDQNFTGQKCASFSDQERIHSFLKLYLIIQSSYFDDKDFSDNPIKKVLRPYYLYSLNGTQQHIALQVGENQVELNDNMLYGTTKYMSYIQTNFFYASSGNTNDNSGLLIVSFYIDDTVKITTRQVFTFVNAISASGGFLSSIMVIAHLLVRQFQTCIYQSSLIRSFYKYQEQLPKNNRNKVVDDSISQSSHTNSTIANLDGANELNQDKFNTLMIQLQNRKKLMYGIKQIFNYYIRSRFCRNLRTIDKHQQHLYQQGIKKIDKELDIRYIVNELRTLRFLSQTLLKKYQRSLIPQFNKHLLNFNDKEIINTKNDIKSSKTVKEIQKEKQQLVIEEGIKRTLDNFQESKIDQRILKNIMLDQTDSNIKFKKKGNKKIHLTNDDGAHSNQQKSENNQEFKIEQIDEIKKKQKIQVIKDKRNQRFKLDY